MDLGKSIYPHLFIQRFFMTERDFEIARELKGRLMESVGLVDFRIFGSKIQE